MLRRRSKKKRATAEAAGTLPPGQKPGELPAITAGNLEEIVESRIKEREALQQKMDSEALSALKLAPVITKTSEILAKHLREQISHDAGLASQILRTWIREEEPDA